MKQMTLIPVLLLSALALAAVAHGAPATAPLTPLEKQVRHEILLLPYYGVFDNISFRVDGRNVTLTGEVYRPLLKSEAQNVVKHIAGVETVTNEIKILPTSFFDDQIRAEAVRYIYGYPVLQRYGAGVQPSIRIIVDNGHLTLEGKVNNETDRNIAFIRANSLPNVFSVTNKLEVEP